MMPIQNETPDPLPRQRLIGLFEKNADLNTYEKLIYSMVNIEDDGLMVKPDEGLILAARPDGKLLSLKGKSERDGGDIATEWILKLNEKDKALLFQSALNQNQPVLSLSQNGKVGLGTENPKFEMDVNGIIGIQGRIGTFAVGAVEADKKWHTISEQLGPCQALEVFAHIREDKSRSGKIKSALTHAVLLLAKGRRTSKAKIQRAPHGSFWDRMWGNKIQFRWKQEQTYSSDSEDEDAVQTERYMLQIRSRRKQSFHDNEYKKIHYRVTKLWDADFEHGNYELPKPEAATQSRTHREPARKRNPDRQQRDPDNRQVHRNAAQQRSVNDSVSRRRRGRQEPDSQSSQQADRSAPRRRRRGQRRRIGGDD